MINNVTLVGRMTKDPELKYTSSGTAVLTFNLAVNRPFTNQQGEREADFIMCQVWRKTAENVANYTRKGSLVGVVGRIQTRNYDDKDGKKVYVTEVVAENVQFLEPKGTQTGGQGNRQGNHSQNSQSGLNGNSGGSPGGHPGGYSNAYQNSADSISISDEDLPF